MVVTEDNIDAVEKMVREDARVTYKDIEASLRIGSGSVAKILHIYLRVSKVSSRWCHTAILRLQVTRSGFTSMIQKASLVGLGVY